MTERAKGPPSKKKTSLRPCLVVSWPKCWNFESSWSKECTAPGSKRRTRAQNVFFRPWTPPSPSVYIPCRHWHHSHNKVDQAFPLRFCILQVIKNWVVRRPGNKTNAYLHTLPNAHSITFQILMTQFILHQQTTKRVKHLLPKMCPLQVELMHTLQALLHSWYAKPTNIGNVPAKVSEYLASLDKLTPCMTSCGKFCGVGCSEHQDFFRKSLHFEVSQINFKVTFWQYMHVERKQRCF